MYLNLNPLPSLKKVSGLLSVLLSLCITSVLYAQNTYEVNVNCGGSAYTSSAGVNYLADSNFDNGTIFSNTSVTINNTSDPVLYQTERYDDNLSYSFPVPINGNYEVTLHFAEVFNKNQAVNKRVFDMLLEGTLVLDDYDIFASVGGYTADVRTFQVNVNDGELNITSSSSVNKAKLCAIQVKYNPPVCNDPNHVPSVDTVSVTICSTDSLFAGGAYQDTSGFYVDTLLNKNACDSVVVTDLYVASCTSPAYDLRINCGGADYTAVNGEFYHADSLFVNGTTFSNTSKVITNTNDDLIFQSERYDANLAYDIPVPNGSYDVSLYFAEIFNKNFDVGKRVFDVLIEGNLVLDDYDIYADVGADAAVIKTFTVTVTDQVLNITTSSSANNAKFCALEIVSSPVDCQLGPWGAWSACDVNCGGGTQFRTRPVLVQDANGGLPCGPTIEYRSCNTQICVDNGLCPKDTTVSTMLNSCDAVVHFPLDSSGLKADFATADYQNVPLSLNDCPKHSWYGLSTVTLNPTGISGNATGADVHLESVYIKMDHDRVGDLVIDLESPNGNVVRLIERPGKYGLWGNGGCNKDDIDALFIPGTGNSAENDCNGNKPVLSGSYTAHDGYDLISLNDSSDPNGVWTLRVYDLRNKKEPTLKAWSLNFKSSSGSIIQIAGLPSGSNFPPGTTTNTLVFTDSLGNSDTCSFDVIVEDNTPPEFTDCPQDVLVCGDPVFWTVPSAVDNCGSVNVVQTGGPAQGSSLADGTYPVTYEATDAAGNTETCYFNLVKAPLQVDAGNDQTIYLGVGSGCALLFASPQNGQWPYTYSWSDGGTGPANIVCPNTSTEYIVTITDANGCTGTDTVQVEVIDISCGKNKVLLCYNNTTYCVNPWIAWYYTSFMGASYGSCTSGSTKKMGDPAQLTLLPPLAEDSYELNVYPNPAVDEAHISWKFEGSNPVEIGLYDLAGRQVMEIYSGIPLSSGDQNEKIRTEHLAPGIYLIMAKAGSVTRTQRLYVK